MISQLSTALEPSLAQVASSSIRFVFATFHGQDRFGRNSSSRMSIVVPAEEACEEWLVSFGELALQFGKRHHCRDVAIAYRFDGMEKKPTFWEYVQNFWQPVFGLRFVDIEPAW